MRSWKLKAPSLRLHKGSGFEINGQISNSQLGVAKLAYVQGAKQALKMIEERLALGGVEGVREFLLASKSSLFYEEIDWAKAKGESES